MEHGIITSVKYKDGVVLCNVQAIRVSTEYKNVPMLKPLSGYMQMPEQGQTVVMDTLNDGTRLILGVMARPGEGERPDAMDATELTIQMDADTELSFTKTDAGDYDVTITASGNVTVESASELVLGDDVEAASVAVQAHTHDYTTDNGATETTTEPNESGTTTRVE